MFKVVFEKTTLTFYKLVINSTQELWQLKRFAKRFKISELRKFRSSLVYLITPKGKKECWKKMCLSLIEIIGVSFCT